MTLFVYYSISLYFFFYFCLVLLVNVCVFYYIFTLLFFIFFFFSSRRRHTRSLRDWSSDVCSSDLRVSHSSFVTRASILTSQLSTTSFRCRFADLGTLPYHSRRSPWLRFRA